MLCIREVAPHETDLAHRWFSLPLPLTLPLSNGDICCLLHAGRPGGPQGPDIRDALLAFTPDQRLRGDVEFHIRCSDWYSHQHHTDPGYNNVILHVVLNYDSSRPILRQDGCSVPVCSLNDIAPQAPTFPPAGYPCEQIIPSMPVGERTSLLQRAGLSRFDQKTQHFLVLLRDARPCGPFSARDTCLIPALAEALGYGRDRAFFRAAGLRLVGLAAGSDLPEPRGRAPAPAPLDASRLRALGEMVARWSTAGAWKTIRRLLKGEIDSMGVDVVDGSGASYGIRPDYLQSVMISALRANFSGISAARADIVICNVVLPFAAAVALLEADQALYAQAQQVYLAYPGLASNQVTRAMRRQLRLDCEPRRACQQQGLHYIYAQTCQEKRCEVCLVTRWGREP